MTDTTELDALLARATELEQKAVDGGGFVDEGLAEVVGEFKAITAELVTKVAELSETVEVLAASSVPGVDPVADREAKADLDSDDGDSGGEGKWEACAVCGSKEVVEYEDGTASCEDCGQELEKKGFDFTDDSTDVPAGLEVKDDDAAEPLAAASGLEVKTGAGGEVVDMSELLARRAELD